MGTVGIPANYGGFETLAENIARYHQMNRLPGILTVYCSAPNYNQRPRTYLGAELRYLPFRANGISSIVYDAFSLISAIWHRSDVILLLGVSGAIALPLVRLVSRARVVTNVDGIEWKRQKWQGAAKWFLRLSESIAVRFSHEIIADNGGIAEYVAEHYGRRCEVVAYGGDHATSVSPSATDFGGLPARYALALCRIEPENNVEMILEAFSRQAELPLVFVGNWSNSAYGVELRQRYGAEANLLLLDPVYEPAMLRAIRNKAVLYVHGHSAGGTNPSLVEMMHFGVPVLAFDCVFNRFTTAENALYFDDSHALCAAMDALTPEKSLEIGAYMGRLASERYTWNVVGKEYFRIMDWP